MNLNNLSNNGFTIVKNALPEYQKYLDIIKNNDYEIHQEAIWNLRLKMKKYFIEIFNDSNLACSFDTYRMGDSPDLE